MLLPQEPVPVGTQFVQLRICFDHDIAAVEAVAGNGFLHIFFRTDIKGQLIRHQVGQLDMIVLCDLGHSIVPERIQ